MRIEFFDISAQQELSQFNGRSLMFDELYDLHCMYRSSSPLPRLNREKIKTMDFHPYGLDANGWKSWEEYVTTAAQLICDCSPSKEELKLIREYIRRLPNAFKRSDVDHRFVLCFVPYLFAGFKAHAIDAFIGDSNSLNALCEFSVALCSSPHVLFSSFLCAHRDAKTGMSLNLLQSHIPETGIRRAAAFVSGLVHNASPSHKGSAVFLQQTPTEFATSSVFPEVTVDYLERGCGYLMLERLQYQYEVVGKVLRSQSTERFRLSLKTLDALTRRLERFLEDRFGKDWRAIDFTASQYESDPIVEIGIKLVLPGIERMMPFFSGGVQPAFLARRAEIIEMNRQHAYQERGIEEADLVSKVISRFMSHQAMHITAKAVYEASFYYLWGEWCGKSKKMFAVGFDREHDRFQHLAWSLGAESTANREELRQSVPLYARRNPSAAGGGTLNGVSLRQFWR